MLQLHRLCRGLRSWLGSAVWGLPAHSGLATAGFGRKAPKGTGLRALGGPGRYLVSPGGEKTRVNMVDISLRGIREIVTRIKNFLAFVRVDLE